MRISILSENAKLCFARALVASELGGNLSLIYEFSYAGGKSGLSFAISQLDVRNNANALLCLRECDFTTDEIVWLKAQQSKGAPELITMNAKLLAHKEIVDRWDRRQIAECLSWPMTLCSEIAMDFANEETFVHIADYHNQFGMSRGGKLYTWLKGLTSPVTPEMIRDFKYTTKYGMEQKIKPREHDDVWRRYCNIVRIMRNE